MRRVTVKFHIASWGAGETEAHADALDGIERYARAARNQGLTDGEMTEDLIDQ